MPPVGFEPTISTGERPQSARLLRSLVRIPPGARIFVCFECRVLSGRVLSDELITRPEESYKLCCVVVCDLETSRIGAPYIYDISNLRIKLAWPITIHCSLSVHRLSKLAVSYHHMTLHILNVLHVCGCNAMHNDTSLSVRT
jgi:hypothetical protein